MCGCLYVVEFCLSSLEQELTSKLRQEAETAPTVKVKEESESECTESVLTSYTAV